MRRSCLAVAALVLISLPAFAQQQGQQPPQKPQGKLSVLGSRTCSDPVPCAGSSDAMQLSASQWAAYGDSCMASAFNYTNPDGYIDDSAGIDSSGCLTAKSPSSQNHNTSGQLMPKCCVVTLPSGACSMHCDLVD